MLVKFYSPVLVLLLQTFVYLYFLLGFNESFVHFKKKKDDLALDFILQ